MTEEIVSYGVLSLIPAILAVVLAFWTKNVIISLMASLFVGCLITAGWNPWNAMQVMFSDHLFVDMTGSSNAQTIIMMSFVGGFVALIEATGGAKAFAAAIANKVHRRSTAQTTAWLGGLAIFFSDSGNSLILGPIFRPIFDRLRISSAKLAYILDSTSSPVCILVPITGWGVYIMGIIATEFENLGIQTSDASAFVQAIPYQFYALLALVLGYPKNMDGTVGPRAEKAAAFAETLRQAAGLPVTLWDERRTTVDAHNILFNNGKNAKKRKKVVDAVAASLMLEGYLTRKRLEAQRHE